MEKRFLAYLRTFPTFTLSMNIFGIFVGDQRPQPNFTLFKKKNPISVGDQRPQPNFKLFTIFLKSLAQVPGDQRPQFDLDQIKKAELPLRMKRELCLFFAALERRTTCQADKTNHPVKRAESQ